MTPFSQLHQVDRHNFVPSQQAWFSHSQGSQEQLLHLQVGDFIKKQIKRIDYIYFTSKLYIPIPQTPSVVSPDLGVPRSTSVLPVGGRYAWYFADRITRDVSQPYDSFVLAMIFVGIPHFAVVVWGEYPCFTSIVIYCIPSFIVTFDDGETSVESTWGLLEYCVVFWLLVLFWAIPCVVVFTFIGVVFWFLRTRTIPRTRINEIKMERIFFI